MITDEKLTLKEAFALWEKPNCGLDEVILEAFKDRKVIFFLGAGVSRIEGVKGWDEFANSLIKKAFPSLKEQVEILRGVASSKEKITIAYEKFCAEGRKEDFYLEFGKALEPSSSFEHVGIYETLAEFNVNFLTTNADSLFENELGKELCHSDYDVTDLFNAEHLPRKQLFYLHGRYSDGLDTLVFTAPQYAQRYNDKKFCNFLCKIFRNNGYVVFFIGYGLNEYELIDYIITKTGTRSKGGGAEIYILEPFFSNQDALYGARKQYFLSLGINLLPYCIDNGYKELNNILKLMLEVFKSQAHVPHDDYSDITYFLNIAYTSESETYVDELLKGNMNYGGFEVACSTLAYSRFSLGWIKHIIKNPLWFPEYSVKEYLGWGENAYSRISLLTIFLKSDSTYSVVISKVKELLLCANREDVAVLKDCHAALLYKYANIICLLKDNMVDDTCFELMEKLFGLYGIYFSYQGLGNGIRITKCSGSKISKLVYSIYNGINIFNQLEEDQAHCLNNIFDKENKITYDRKLSQAFFTGMYEFVVIWLEKNKLDSGVYNVRNLDNLKKAGYSGLSVFLQKVVIYFNGMSGDCQKKYVQQGLQSENDLICKIWIYILRKSERKNDLSFIINKRAKCFSYSTCICELYLLIKNADIEQYHDCLNKRIKEADFGLDILYHDKSYKLRIANSFIKAIGGDVSGESEDIIGTAEQYDYAHIVEDYFPPEANLPMEDIFHAIESEEDKHLVFNKVYALGEKLVGLPNDEFTDWVKRIERLKDDALNSMILYFIRNVQNLSKEKQIVIYECAIRVLLSDHTFEILYKNCFFILAEADLNLFYSNLKKGLNECWEKWNNKLLGAHLEEKLSNSFIYDLINTAEYNKITFFCNFWIARRHFENIFLTDDEIRQIKSAIRDITVKLCIAYKFNYICNVVKDPSTVNSLLDCIVSHETEPYDYVALFLIVSNLKVINDYVRKLLVDSKMLEKCDLLEAIDQVSLQSFYNYIGFLYLKDQISLSIIMPVTDKKYLYDSLLLYINKGLEENDDSYVKKLVGELWPNVKNSVLKNKQLVEYLLRSILSVLRRLINRGSINLDLIEIARQLLEVCQDGSVEILIRADHLIDIYRQDEANGKEIIKLFLLKSQYIQIYKSEVEKIFIFVSKEDNKYAKDLLRVLYNAHQISLEYFETLYQMVE